MLAARRSLTGEKKSSGTWFFQTTACSSYVQPWLVAIGGWQLVEIAGWRLAVGGWRRLAAVGGSLHLVMACWWRLEAVHGWRLIAVDGWRRLSVGGWWSLGAVLKGGQLTKKRSGPLRTPLLGGVAASSPSWGEEAAPQEPVDLLRRGGGGTLRCTAGVGGCGTRCYRVTCNASSGRDVRAWGTLPYLVQPEGTI